MDVREIKELAIKVFFRMQPQATAFFILRSILDLIIG